MSIEARKAVEEKLIDLCVALAECDFEDGVSEFYSCRQDDETLTCTSPDEAIDEYMSDLFGEIPESVTVYRFEPLKVPAPLHDPVQYLLDELEEELGDPSGRTCKPTKLMQAANELLVEIVQRQYRPWMCRLVDSEEHSLEDWDE